MKKTVLTIACALAVSMVMPAYSMSTFYPFKTVDDAAQQCPALDKLTYVADPSGKTFDRIIAPANDASNGIAYSTREQAEAPANMGKNNSVEGVQYYLDVDHQFMDEGPYYGYTITDPTSSPAVYCFYSYTGISGNLVAISLEAISRR